MNYALLFYHHLEVLLHGDVVCLVLAFLQCYGEAECLRGVRTVHLYSKFYLTIGIGYHQHFSTWHRGGDGPLVGQRVNGKAYEGRWVLNSLGLRFHMIRPRTCSQIEFCLLIEFIRTF